MSFFCLWVYSFLSDVICMQYFFFYIFNLVCRECKCLLWGTHSILRVTGLVDHSQPRLSCLSAATLSNGSGLMNRAESTTAPHDGAESAKEGVMLFLLFLFSFGPGRSGYHSPLPIWTVCASVGSPHWLQRTSSSCWQFHGDTTSCLLKKKKILLTANFDIIGYISCVILQK